MRRGKGKGCVVISNDFSMIIFPPTLKRVDLKRDVDARKKETSVWSSIRRNIGMRFPFPSWSKKIVAAGGEGREWRQKEMSAIG